MTSLEIQLSFYRVNLDLYITSILWQKLNYKQKKILKNLEK